MLVKIHFSYLPSPRVDQGQPSVSCQCFGLSLVETHSRATLVVRGCAAEAERSGDLVHHPRSCLTHFSCCPDAGHHEDQSRRFSFDCSTFTVQPGSLGHARASRGSVGLSLMFFVAVVQGLLSLSKSRRHISIFTQPLSSSI